MCKVAKYSELNTREFEVHMIVLNMILSNSKVLDIGCATGYLGKELIKKFCEVYGIEKDETMAKKASKYYKKVLIEDLENLKNLAQPKKYFDYVLLLDVMEHIMQRERLLKKIKSWLNSHGFLILSTPNIAHISIRLKLLLGNFKYTNSGILDETHVHFFTRKTLIDLLNKMGYEIQEIIPTADFGQIPIIGRFLRYLPKKLQFKITKLAPENLAPQFVIICKPGEKITKNLLN